MDLQEFKSKNPEFVKKARECKDTFEFTKLAEAYGIKLGADAFDKAYALFCQPDGGNANGELSDEMLENAAGGISATFNAESFGFGGPKDTTIISFN